MSSSSHPRASLRPSPSTAPTSSGSQTITQPTAPNAHPTPTLRLRATSPTTHNTRRIQWDESVVDNEGMGKKSSKVCCIYHAPHEPGDSDSDSSSSSDGDSDGEPDLSRAQKAGGRGRGKRKGGGEGEGEGAGAGKRQGKERKASPNAYERQPKVKAKKDGG